MPFGLRNATPGPSALGRNVNAHAAGGIHGGGGGVAQGRSNMVKKKEDKDRERQKALKRPSSEEVLDEEERDRKKARFVEDFDEDDATNAKDTKEKRRKRRKKRKRPIPVVFGGSSETSQRSEAEEMTLALHPSSETLVNGSHGQATSHSLAVEMNRVNGVKVDDKADDEAPTYSSSDKGKGKAKPDSCRALTHENPNYDNHNPGSGSTPRSDTRSTTLEGPDQSSEVARLKEQLAEQGKLLERHQSHLNQQQQTLTCQICLELMHRPYALIPCGHVTCYGCLVRWFTSDLNAEEEMTDEEQQQANEHDHPNGDDLNTLLNSAAAKRGTFVRRRKTCPVCRGVVPDRPVEMWDIKQMVAALVKSHLVDLPVPPGAEFGEESSASGNNTPNDPWRNLFRPNGVRRGLHRHGGPPPRGQEDDEEEREQFGWYDLEDGGVYRCVECFHELWGGMCTGCQRVYLGHEAEDDDDDDEEEEEEDLFYDDDDEMGAFQWAGYLYLQDELRRRLNEDEGEEEEEENGMGGVYNAEHLQDEVRGMDEWFVRGDMEGEGDIDVESIDGFIDDEERMRSGVLDGIGDVDSEEGEATSEPSMWARGRTLRSRIFSEEEEGTSGFDEGPEVDSDDRMGRSWGGTTGVVDRWGRGRNLLARSPLEGEETSGLDESDGVVDRARGRNLRARIPLDEFGGVVDRWARGRNLRARSRLEGEGISGLDEESDDADDEIRRSPAVPLRRSTRRRTLASPPVAESYASSSDDNSEHRAPPPRSLRWGLRRRQVMDESEDEDEF